MLAIDRWLYVVAAKRVRVGSRLEPSSRLHAVWSIFYGVGTNQAGSTMLHRLHRSPSGCIPSCPYQWESDSALLQMSSMKNKRLRKDQKQFCHFVVPVYCFELFEALQISLAFDKLIFRLHSETEHSSKDIPFISNLYS